MLKSAQLGKEIVVTVMNKIGYWRICLNIGRSRINIERLRDTHVKLMQ